jgi:hypothetical protein
VSGDAASLEMYNVRRACTLLQLSHCQLRDTGKPATRLHNQLLVQYILNCKYAIRALLAMH